MLADAYHARFTGKPAYMTDYNGKTALPGSPGDDPNLDTDAQGAMYYPLVTRAKAAKALYFMWVLAQAPKAENG